MMQILVSCIMHESNYLKDPVHSKLLPVQSDGADEPQCSQPGHIVNKAADVAEGQVRYF